MGVEPLQDGKTHHWLKLSEALVVKWHCALTVSNCAFTSDFEPINNHPATERQTLSQVLAHTACVKKWEIYGTQTAAQI
jgi:hypothetical protein